MRILLCNNNVRHGGGIDAVVELEQREMVRAAHSVTLFGRSNTIFDDAPLITKLRTLSSTLYSFPVKRELMQLLDEQPFDLAHVHNTVPLLTGAIYDALRSHADILVVQSLHNYRGFCPSSYCYRDGEKCDDCTAFGENRCIRYGCYRQSRLQSAGLVLSRRIDRKKGRPLAMDADAYIAVSSFVKDRYVEHGLPPDRVHVLHNSAPDLRKLAPRSVPEHALRKRLVFVGSLLRQKGIFAVAELATIMPGFDFHLIGEGEDRGALETMIKDRSLNNITLHGYLKKRELTKWWEQAFLTLALSLWDEPCPIIAGESLSLGIPVVTTGAGGLRELVADGECGLIVDVDQPQEVAALIRALWEDRATYKRLQKSARERYDLLYAEQDYGQRLTELLKTIQKQHTRNQKKR